MTDFTNGNQNTAAVTLNRVLAPNFEFLDWRNFKRGVYRNERSQFEVVVETGHDMTYTPAEGDYFQFIFDDSVTVPNYLYCEYQELPNGPVYPSVDCNLVGPGTINMILHFRLPILSNRQY